MNILDKEVIVPIIFILIIFAGVIIYFFDDKRRTIRLMSSLKNSNINNLKINELIKVSGKAKSIREPLIVPYSKRKCVYYLIKIEEEKGDDDNSYWRTIIKEEKTQEFLLEKNGDIVFVKLNNSPKNYKSQIIIDKKVTSGTFNDATHEFESLLKKYNLKSTGFLGFNKQLRYTESIIEVGEEITIAGFIKWKNINKTINGYSYSKIPSIESSKQQKIIITDIPKEKLNKK